MSRYKNVDTSLKEISKEDIKLKYIQFTNPTLIDFQIVTSYEGEIIVKDNYVIFKGKNERQYLIPFSNITSGVIA